MKGSAIAALAARDGADGAREERFDYEAKVWGNQDLTLRPTDLGALRLRYCLEALAGVRGLVLEVGCGAGQFARALRRERPDLRVVASDISASALHAAPRRAGVHYVQGDGLDLPFADGSLAAIVLFDVLEHVERPERLLDEARRVLAPGGLFHAFVPCERSLFTLHGLAHRLGWTPKRRYAGHIQQFTMRELAALLRARGFEVADARYSLHLVNQAFDLLYFTALALARQQMPRTLEGLAAERRRTLLGRLLRLATGGVAVASYVESRALARIPGLGVHVTARPAAAS